jgi:hypothetical protein
MVVFMTGLSSRPAHMRTVAIPPRPIFGQECDARKYLKLGELRDCYIPFIDEFAPLLLEVEEADAEVRHVERECICTPSRRKLAGLPRRQSEILHDRQLIASAVARSVPVWPPHRPIDPALYTPVVVDRRRYSGDWWKVQQEEARALREKKGA